MLNDLTILALAVALVNYASALGVTIHAVLWKRDSRAVIGWVGLAWLAPLVGVFAYLCLGVNRIERKALFFACPTGLSRRTQCRRSASA